MDVLVVRHGIAMDREEAHAQAMGDRDRPLTSKGRKRAKSMAKGLAKRAPDLASLFTSPLRRAIETAEIVAKAYDDIDYTGTPALLPDADPAELTQFLAESASASLVAVVGHEPHLTRWIGWCLLGEARSVVDLRKGGACRLRFDDAPGPGKGRLLWLIQPSMFRRA